MGIIYKAINKINGKSYIGQTINDEIPKDRHFSNALNDKKYLLSKAIRKYGYENFDWEILCECESKKDLDEMENYHILKYCAHMSDNGYNMTWGGDGGDTFSCKSEEEKVEISRKISKSISKSQLGVPRTERAKKALSEAQKKLWQNSDYRKKQIESFKRSVDLKRYSRVSKKNWENAEYRDKIEKKYVITFPDGSERIVKGLRRFCRLYKLNPSNLIGVARKNRSHHKGYKARYYHGLSE